MQKQKLEIKKVDLRFMSLGQTADEVQIPQLEVLQPMDSLVARKENGRMLVELTAGSEVDSDVPPTLVTEVGAFMPLRAGRLKMDQADTMLRQKPLSPRDSTGIVGSGIAGNRVGIGLPRTMTREIYLQYGSSRFGILVNINTSNALGTDLDIENEKNALAELLHVRLSDNKGRALATKHLADSVYNSIARHVDMVLRDYREQAGSGEQYTELLHQ